MRDYERVMGNVQ